MDFWRAIVDFIAYVASLAPPVVWPALLGALFAMAVTEAVKRRYVRRQPWDKQKRDDFLHSFGFWTGFGATWTLWIMAEPTFKQRVYGGFWAVIVGIATPALWGAAVRLVGMRWPTVRDYLSSDTQETPKP